MTSFPGQANDRMGLSDQAGSASGRLVVANWQSFTVADAWPTALPRFTNLISLQPENFELGTVTNLDPDNRAPLGKISRPGALVNTVAEDWFEDVHVLPRSLDVGLILSTTQFIFQVFNSDRKLPHDWDAFTNNVDNGVQIIDLPTLPFTLLPLGGSVTPTTVTLEVTPEGPAQINGTLDFQFDFPVDPTILAIEVTGSRIVLFAFRPNRPLTERLEFLTDILEHQDGTEQRIAMRKNPRQVFEMSVPLEDGPERQRAEFLLFNWQDKQFAIPVWPEPSVLTADVIVASTTINVNTTAFADFRVGGLAVVLESQTKFDALVIQSLTATSITFASPTNFAYSAGVEVYPLRTALAGGSLSGVRYPINLDELSLRFRVTDNDSDLADTSAFSTFNSKVLLDDDNFIRGTTAQTLVRKLQQIDNLTGLFEQVSLWDRSRRGSAKLAITTTRQRLWEYRQLLHALRGRQISFYLPTFYKDLEIAATLTSGGTTGTITNVGYNQHVQERQPNNVIRVELVDGTVFVRTITDSAPIDDDTERITIDVGWPQTIEPSDVVRVDILEKVRLDTDSVTIRHFHAAGEAEIVFPVRVVTE